MIKNIYLCRLIKENMADKYTISSKLLGVISALITATMLWSCSTFPENELRIDHSHNSRPQTPEQDRESEGCRDKVFIIYSMGFNNLSYDLNEDINDLLTGEIPSFNPKDDALIILSHTTQNNRSNYKTATSPVLFQAYKSVDGSVKRDTLIVYPEGSVAASKDILSEVLTYVKTEFPAKHYGMLVSSHATGWAPEMYCYSPPDKSSSGIWMSKEKTFKPLEKYTAERPLTKSIGSHFNGSSANADEIELQDFVEAIPFHLDYLIFDCCLMGGIEVAYELKNVCDKICFSQTEILSEGMDYIRMASHIFGNSEPDIEAIAYDYYSKYAAKYDDVNRSATISVVDCRKLGPIADIIKRNRDAIATLADKMERTYVQKYYQSRYSRNHGIFFDLEDIVIKAGVPESELEALSNALEECVTCKFATPTFLKDLEIQHHSGFSMYLTDPDRTILNSYYTTLEWNKYTQLIGNNE